jgi:iron complex outermembrane recepter protein
MFRTTTLCSRLMLAFGGGFLAALPAAAQQQLDRVEITGSSIKRIDAESALPIQVLTREDIARTGATTVEQLLQTVSAITSSGGFTASAVSGGTTGSISSISLHGLSSLRTLVLLNGRRIAPYGIGFTGDSVSVDVNSIPLAAIERVEVLKDGASAVYGSDAIGGVVNFILRKTFTGAELEAYYGDTTRGGASMKRISGSWGLGDMTKDRFNVMAVASFQKEEALFGRDRAFASAANFAEGNDTTSGNTFPANVAAVDGSFGTVNPSNPTCPGPYATNKSPFLSLNGCRFDPSPLVQLVPAAERASVFVSGALALSNDVELYAEASYNRNKQNNIIQPVPLSDQFNIPLNHPLANVAPYNQFTALPSSTIILKSTSPFYPTALVTGITGGATPDLFVRYRSAVTGNRDITDISEAPRMVVGAKGLFAGWDFDTSLLHSGSKVTEQVNNGFPSLSKILPLLNSGTVNFFGANTPAIDDQLRATNFVGNAFVITSTLDSAQLKMSREVAQVPAGALAVAGGVEARREKYQFDADPTIQTGDISGYGGNFLNTSRSRKVGSVFGEVSVPIVKGLEAGAAVRFDKYQGVGNSTTPKVNLRWQASREVLMRGSVGRGFRAPSLQDLYLPQQTGVTVPGLSDPLRCPATNDGIKDCSTQFAVLISGTPTLVPEKSTNTTLGFVLEPASGLSVAIDWFKINLKNPISNGIDPAIILTDAASLAKYSSLVKRGPVDPAFPNLPGPISQIDQSNINLGEFRITGVDFDAKLRLPANSLGKVTISFSGTHFIQYDTQNPDGSFTPTVNTVNSATGGVIPRWKTYLSTNLTSGPWSATLAYNWQNGYEDISSAFTGVNRRVAAYHSFDSQVQFTWLKNTTLTVGINNLFDRDPPYSNAGGQTSFQSGYDPQYADPRGRFIYGSVKYAF